MRFEDLLEELGGFSKFQFLVLLLLSLPRLILPLHFLLHNFISATPPHRCSTLGGLSSPLGTPTLEDGYPGSCEVFFNSSNTSTSTCPHGWIYDRSQFSSTTATEWDLVCEDKKLNQAIASYFFMGVMLGAILFGQLSDKFGRRPMLLLSFCSSAVLGVAAAFSTSYTMFTIFRTLCGVALTGMTITTLALSVEWVGVTHRTFTGTIMSLAWSVGNMLLALLAYFIRDWRHLMLVVTSPLIVAVASWWWIPESARWLLVQGRVEEAQRYLDQCGKMNNKKTDCLDTETLRNLSGSSQTASYLDLVRTPGLRRISLCSGAVCFRLTGFGLNIYVTQFLFGAIEVPAKVGAYFLLNLIGRRNGQACFLMVTGGLIGVNAALPADWEVLRACVAVVSKGFSEASFTTAFLYTAELYPTLLRQCGLGYTSFVGRAGGSLVPMVMLLEDVWSPLPPLLFSLVGLIGGAFAFLLPETLDRPLAENIQDIEEGRHMQIGGVQVEMQKMTSSSEDPPPEEHQCDHMSP
ncbi:hypothetical protein NHX12_017933 [Muraenolepis orangiensis]|uniref:Major facilitator superfamily (MFS) profile domain-containing protein n=1 Tax=Muraenolepis orangiensis TaxID=630683 RepID=A0A9Q0EW31_9TELE|nr:hypothetical protein NHX12_017933 [Muraenolepis orangiensis]